ncbi:LysR family transcriptional regulator [Bordetella genomosp. 5]|uniref:LysR family transcriptional regulator n=1 Tax=Bordetella genomosp. 5 TaxID=1395608 RepID=A0A261TYG5_9BORD|nr:LysR family transcriptional regulator [Bordetella genomosp. 5]OZI54202.1 LysR family transcriptional regulator [Bordetella genomosp. 5]
MLTSDHIETLLRIVDTGSFSAAARALRRTPSAVSMAVANLEAELGLVLFDRSRREPVPTPAMAALLPGARLIDEQLSALRAHALHLSSGVEARLRIGVAAELDDAPVMRALSAIAQRYPALEIQVRRAPQDEIVDALHRSAVDLCVAYGGLELHAQESIHALWTETLMAVAAPAHALGARKAWPIETLALHRQVVVANPEVPMSDARPVISSRVWQVDNTAGALALVEAGHGWANLPRGSVREALARKSLVALRFSNTRNGLNLPVYLRLPRHTGLGKAAAELAEGLRAEARELG